MSKEPASAYLVQILAGLMVAILAGLIYINLLAIRELASVQDDQGDTLNSIVSILQKQEERKTQ